jgi:hypothetical protein
MTDLSLTIDPKSDQLNADDLIGGPRTILITRVSGRDTAEQPIAINFEGDNGKPYLPCKSMRRVLVQVWGKDGNQYPGRSMTLYRDPAVKFGGLEVGGIRISHMSHLDEPKTMALTATRASRKPFTVRPLPKSQQSEPAADPAANWAASYIAKVRGAKDAAALKTFIDGKAAKLDELRQKRPELAAEIDLAVADAKPADMSFEDDFGIDEPTPQPAAADDGSAGAAGPSNAAEEAAASAQEGRADEDMGESHSGADDHPARAAADEIIARAGKVGNMPDLNSLRADRKADIAAMPDSIRAEVDQAFDNAEKRLKAGR